MMCVSTDAQFYCFLRSKASPLIVVPCYQPMTFLGFATMPLMTFFGAMYHGHLIGRRISGFSLFIGLAIGSYVLFASRAENYTSSIVLLRGNLGNGTSRFALSILVEHKTDVPEGYHEIDHSLTCYRPPKKLQYFSGS